MSSEDRALTGGLFKVNSAILLSLPISSNLPPPERRGAIYDKSPKYVKK